MDPLQYVYLLQEREFVNNKEPVYKIGKTKQPNLQRVNSYPKGSVLLLQTFCNDCNKTEKGIIKLFDTKYKKRTDRCREYYEGNYMEMTIDIYKIINYEKEIEENKNKKIANEVVKDIIDDLITNVFTISEEKEVDKKKEIIIESEEKKIPKYLCECCNYITCKKQNYDKHILTPKHITNKEQNKTKEEIEAEKIYSCKICSKKYVTSMGLWKHKKICLEIHKNKINNTKNINEIEFINYIENNKEFLQNIINKIK
jgi:hypothetical protein